MKQSPALRLAWFVCALTIALISLGVWLMFLNEVNLAEAGLPVLPLCSAVVGALIAARHPANPVGWIFLASALFGTLRAFFGEYAIYGIRTEPGSVPFAWVAAWLSAVLRIPGPMLGFVFLPLYFPTGKLPSRRWNLMLWVVLVTVVPAMLLDALMPGEAVYKTGIQNPLGIEALSVVKERFGGLSILWIIGLIFAAAASLIFRYLRSPVMERQQIKWFTFAVAVIPVWFLFNAPVQRTFPIFFSIVDSLIIAGVPIAAGIAILRHRLYDIDIIINRALVYALLTLSLVGTYLAGVVGLQHGFRSLTGQESSLAVVGSTLAIAALFSPVRLRIQESIDRLFYRKKYDAEKTLEAFSERLRKETDLETLSGDLVGVVRETMQPAHVSLWLKPEEPEERAK